VQLFGGVMRIVGLVGRARAGKSTAAEALVRERGFVSIGFADALKDLALRVNPKVNDGCTLAEVVEWHGWDYAKKGTHEVRRFLQELGTGVRDIDPQFWLQAWESKAVAALSDGQNVVVPDVRFLNEAAFLGDRHMADTLLIRITRPGLDTSDTHVSETEQLGIKCDVEITNNGTAQQLGDYAIGMVDDWTRIPAA
jgi:hypothetical protein